MSRSALASENFASFHVYISCLHLTYFISSFLSHFSYYLSIILHIVHCFIQSNVMFLLPSIDNQIFQNLKFIMLWFNWHVAFEKYVVVLARFKKFKKDVTRRVWIQCDRDRKSSVEEEIQHSSNRRCNCFFKCTTIFVNEIFWHLKVVVLNYNHEFFLIDAHSTQRKIVMKKHKSKLSRQLKIHIKSTNVLSSLRVEDFTTNKQTLNARQNDKDEVSIINSLFVTRDIYNFRAALRRVILKSFTSIQALIKKFDAAKFEWTYEFNLNDESQIIHFFFNRCFI